MKIRDWIKENKENVLLAIVFALMFYAMIFLSK